MKIHIPADFTLNELQAFIEGKEAAEPPEGYYTAQEWADHFDISITRMRKILNQAKDKGLLDMIYARRKTLDEKSGRVPVYALRTKDADNEDAAELDTKQLS